MATPLNSFPSLIPLPSDSVSTSQPQSKSHTDPESDIDKFATLFNPQTPPASPTLPPIFTESKPTSSIRSSSISHHARQPHRHGSGTSGSGPISPGSAGSDFGFFVSVPPTQDPLSGSFFPSTPPASSASFASQFAPILTPAPITSVNANTNSHSIFSPNSTHAPTPKPAPAFPHPNTTSPHIQTHAHRNPSLDFFGQFVEDAKKNERSGRGRSYLDELLMHEDDPLYFVKSEAGHASTSTSVGEVGAGAELGGYGGDEGGGGEETGGEDGVRGDRVVGDMEVSLLDLDLDSDATFAPRNGGNGFAIGNGNGHSIDQQQLTTIIKPPDHHPAQQQPPKPKPTKPFATPSLSPTFPFASRSPPRPRPHPPPPRSASTQPTPTIINTETADTNDPSSPSSGAALIARSSSSSSIPSLSTLSSRWMSSLLSSSRPSAPSIDDHHKHPSINDIFPGATSTTNDNKSRPPSSSSSSDDLPHPRLHHPRTQSSLPSPTAISTLQHQHSTMLPTPSTSFAASTAPISFSPSSLTSSAASTISHGTPFASRPFLPPSGAPGFAGDHSWDKGFSDGYFDGERVERNKGGASVKLEGRREMTSAVLEREVVGLIRPHLPALARLPRTWSLLYSLDQHGISLNTLYTRCEPQGPTSSQPRGSLVVMKDSGDAIFGAWLGEGLKLSKGSYYGSGESFLWRYLDGKLSVFKWTGKNDYVALCEPGYLSFGGGDGRYGLYLDDTLLDGSSARCPTFDNEPLCSSSGAKKGGNVTFECVGLEVWAVGPS